MSLKAHIRICREEFELDAQMELPADQISALYGPSGAGKTSILRAVAGLDRLPTSQVSFAGQVWQDTTRFLLPHQRKLGYVMQEPSLFKHLDVRANIEYGWRRTPPETRAPLEPIVAVLELEGLLSRSALELSGGERQRVAIARALAVQPQLLLLDEPLGSLDQARQHELMGYLQTIQAHWKMPVLMVTHVQAEVAQLARHLVLIDAGKVLAAGDAAELMSSLDNSLADDPAAVCLLSGVLVQHDDPYHLSYVQCSAGRFSVARLNQSPGTTVRLQIAARDVSLALVRPTGSSMLNLFDATVVAQKMHGPSQVTVKLRCGEDYLLARITRKSADALNITTGQSVVAQVKSVAVFASY